MMLALYKTNTAGMNIYSSRKQSNM